MIRTIRIYKLTGNTLVGLSFLSTEGAKRGDGGSGLDVIERESDNFLFGFKSLFTTGGGISYKMIMVIKLMRNITKHIYKSCYEIST